METSKEQILASGGARWTYCTEAVHAKLCQYAEKEREIRMTVGSGEKCLEQYVKSSPVGSVLKTLLASKAWYHPLRHLIWKMENVMRGKRMKGSSTELRKTSEGKVMMSKYLLFRLAPQEHRTKGTESGLLPTVQVQGLKRCMDGKMDYYPTGMLPTPTVADAGAAAVIGKKDSFVQNTNGTWRKINKNGTNGSVSIARMAALNLLPTVRMSKAGGMDLSSERIAQRNKGNIEKYVARAVLDGFSPEDGKGSLLNPLFVEEMMGFPLGWTTLPFLTKDGEMNP